MLTSAAPIIEILNEVLRVGEESIPLHEPNLDTGNEKEYVSQCITSGWVSSVGSYVDDFAVKLAEQCKSGFAIPTVNGTSALHIALKLAGIKEGDEVLMPALTFVATANAVSYCGAIPHFVDVEEVSLGIDSNSLSEYLSQTTNRTKQGLINKFTGRKITAVVPVHVFGHPVDMEPLLELAKEFDLVVVEDAAAGLGSYYKDKPLGSIGKLSAISFNGNKIITTGSGGGVLTNDPKLAEQARHLTTTAKLSHAWKIEHDEVGFNYRMANINAALGCAQLEKLEYFVELKRKLAERYSQAFSQLSSVKFFKEASYAKSNYWLNSILLDIDCLEQRDTILAELNEAGFLCRPVWTLLNKLSIYSHCPAMDLTISETLEKKIINLPSSPILEMH